jgi:MFS family permease
MTIVARVNQVIRPQGKLFYGWYIVGASSGLQMLAGMLWMQSYGAYVVMLQDEFSWSKAWVAGAFAMTRIESGILGPLQGWLTDQYGPRAVLRVGITLFALGFLLFSQIQSLLGFYLTFALIAIGASLGGYATVMVAIVNWFDRHRSKAVACAMVGYSIGGLSVPIVILFLEAFGWRVTAILSGIVVFVVGIPLAQLVHRKPEVVGETKDGIAEDPGTSAQRLASSGPDFTARQAMRTRAFWLISIGHACSLLVVSAVMVHLVPHLIEGLHYSLPQAGLVVALMTGFQLIGQMSGGFLGDRVSKRLICAGCMVGHALGLLMIAYASSLAMVIGFAFINGISWGTRGPMMVALRADYYGASSFGTIIGFSSLVAMLGMSIGPIFAGYLADIHGSYDIGFTIIAIGAFLGSFAFYAAKPPQHPNVIKHA